MTVALAKHGINGLCFRGVVRGYPDGNFQPVKQVNRQELAVLIGQALLRSGKAQKLDANRVQTILAGFADADAVAPWAREAETVTMLARLWVLLQK